VRHHQLIELWQRCREKGEEQSEAVEFGRYGFFLQVIVTGDHECGYLTGPGSDPTWEPIINNGAGNLPGVEPPVPALWFTLF
jgi:hypothetical protein